MPLLLDNVKVATATTGTGSTIAIGSAVSTYQTPAQAGAVNGMIYRYRIDDGTDWEIGTVVYDSGTPQFTNRTVIRSTNSDAELNLSGSATVSIVASQLDIFGQTGDVVCEELHNEVLSSAGNFDITSISQNYDRLLLVAKLRSSVSAAGDNAAFFLNNDTTATNYRRAVVFQGDVDATYPADDSLIDIIGDTGQADAYSVLELHLNLYAQSIVQTIFGYMYERRSTANTLYLKSFIINWESATAISRITIQPDGYSTDKFIAGCSVQLMGFRTVS